MTLKDARLSLGWTQERLAAASGVVQQRISQLEKGQIRRISLEDTRKIMRALHRAGLKGLTDRELFPSPQEAKAS